VVARINGQSNVATLGPEGTCSEKAANHYIDQNNIKGQVILYPTFEESIKILEQEKADLAVVPSAYDKLNLLVFEGLGMVVIDDTFTMDTPNLVMAVNNYDVKTVASHPAPSSLVKRLFPEADIKFTDSNSVSASELAEGNVDACLTTIIAAQKYKLNIEEDFGPVPMGWNVFKKYGGK